MEYRILYNDTEVLSCIEHEETSITRTKEKAFVGELDEAIHFFRRKNIDYSSIVFDFDLEEESIFDVIISNYVFEETDNERKVTILSMPMDFSTRTMYASMLITYIDESGLPIEKRHTFKIGNDFLLNEGMETEIGEFDYFFNLVMIEKNATLPDAIRNKVLEMDSRGIFDAIY